MSNTVLDHRNLLRASLQNVIDLVYSKPDELNPQFLFQILSSSFSPDFEIFESYEKILQITCGKRAECIESRRERLVSEIQVKHVQHAVRKIRPSSEYLFSKESLSPLIQSLGGV